MVANPTPTPPPGPATGPSTGPSTGPESAKKPDALPAKTQPASQPAKQAAQPIKPAPQPAKPAPGYAGNPDVTRAGVIWVAISVGLILLVLLIIFILQNQAKVSVTYFGAVGELPLGMALFIASVGGGIVVAVAGAVRILQLRKQGRRQRAAAVVRAQHPGSGNTGTLDKH